MGKVEELNVSSLGRTSTRGDVGAVPPACGTRSASRRATGRALERGPTVADSPMERAVRALENDLTGPTSSIVLNARRVVPCLADLRTSDPEAFATVLAECGVATHEMYFYVSEGQAVIEGRVVELELLVQCDADTVPHGVTEPCTWEHMSTGTYRVKPERSDRHTETTPHAAWQALADEPLGDRHTEDA